MGTRGGSAVGGEAKVTPGGLCPESWEGPDDLLAHSGSQDYPITVVTWEDFGKNSRPVASPGRRSGELFLFPSPLPGDSDMLFCSIPVVSVWGAGEGDVAFPGDIR